MVLLGHIVYYSDRGVRTTYTLQSVMTNAVIVERRR